MATATDTRADLADRLEAVARGIMAARERLRRVPGTHAERAEMSARVDELLDRISELRS